MRIRIPQQWLVDYTTRVIREVSDDFDFSDNHDLGVVMYESGTSEMDEYEDHDGDDWYYFDYDF